MAISAINEFENMSDFVLPEVKEELENLIVMQQHFVEEKDETVQLKNRYWHITDAKNNFEEIRGPGVVGDQPILKPGSSYRYKSYCPLTTEFGVMYGYFGMTTNNGKKFNAKINPFRLSVPHSIN